jgi:hypothetical protein
MRQITVLKLVLPPSTKGCRRFVKIQMYLYTKECLDTSKFKQTSGVLLWTEVVLYPIGVHSTSLPLINNFQTSPEIK